MRLTRRALDRTLLRRQHLLERTNDDPLAVVEHLLGLQAQDHLPPYLSLAARVEGFDPHDLSAALEQRRAVRFFTMRGTIHVLTPDDALALRPWVQTFLDRQRRSDQLARPAEHLSREEVAAVVADVLDGGTASVAELRAAFEAAFPGTDPGAVVQVSRQLLPLVQAPPRGLWRRSGGVVYADVEDWLGAPRTELDVPGLVRRFLRAYGPATAADVTAWSGVTRLGPVVTAMADELDVHTGPDGKPLYDVPGAPLAEEDEPAPVRLLGKYDNVWLSHAARDRVFAPGDRRRWMGPNGGRGNALLVDGVMAGLWSTDGKDREEVRVEPWRRLTRAQRAGLDEELERVRALLAVPAYDGAGEADGQAG